MEREERREERKRDLQMVGRSGRHQGGTKLCARLHCPTSIANDMLELDQLQLRQDSVRMSRAEQAHLPVVSAGCGQSPCVFLLPLQNRVEW